MCPAAISLIPGWKKEVVMHGGSKVRIERSGLVAYWLAALIVFGIALHPREPTQEVRKASRTIAPAPPAKNTIGL
jgi:hypothetical protein